MELIVEEQKDRKPEKKVSPPETTSATRSRGVVSHLNCLYWQTADPLFTVAGFVVA